ncbi:MAG: hypothetical protein KC933_37710, partial [Myxococcales bacterium]|nr:hypothetical protein [Myxococcales bacterium]
SGVTLTSVRVLGAAAVLPGTAVTVDGLHVGGGMSVRGSLSGQRVTVAPSGLDVFAGGQADLQEATLQGGLRISGGGRAHLRAAVIREGGIGLDGATLEASDVWVHDAPGDGATVSGAALSLERAVIERSAIFGVQLVGSTTSTLTDVRVADTGDHAVWVSGDVHLLGERLALTDAGGEGLRSEVDPEGAPEPKLDLSDVLVRGVQEESCLAFLRTTKATLRRARLEQCGIIGLRTDRRGTEVDASDIVVAGASLGLRFEGGSATTLTRALVASSRAAGLCVDDPGTALVARHVRVQDTLRVANDSCIDLVAGAGLGMAVHSGAQIDLEAFEVENSAALGVELGSPSMNSFRDGVIRDGPVGVHSVNVWREPDLMRGIRYEGNGLDLDVLME